MTRKTALKVLGIFLLIGLVTFAFKSGKITVGPEGTNGNYIIPFDQQTETLRIINLAAGSSSGDSLLVHNDATNYTRRIAPLNSFLANYPLSSSLSSVATSGAYNDLTNKPTIPNYTAGNGISIVGGVITNTSPAQSVGITGGNRISVTGTFPNFTISYIEPTINQVSRNINTNYTISTTKQSKVFYSIPVTATNPLLLGTSAGTATLQYSTNGGTTWTTALPTSASSSVGLSVTIQLTTGGSNLLAGEIPANALVRIASNVSGTATVGNAVGQEIY